MTRPGSAKGTAARGAGWRRRRFPPRRVSLAVAALLAWGGASCAFVREARPPDDYEFSHALFNEAHSFAGGRVVPRATATARPRRTVRRAEPASPPAPAAPRPVATAIVAIGAPSPVLPETAPAADPGSGDRRTETLGSARRLLGMRDAFDARGFLHHLLEVGDVRLPGVKSKPLVRDVYRALRSQHLTYDRKDPQPGDLVFFHNTVDANEDGRQNDWYSLVGVVEAVGEDGTIALILPLDGEVSRRVMNLRHPEARRLESSGAVLNDVLRQKRLDDPPYAQYLAGELYAGFAALPR